MRQIFAVFSLVVLLSACSEGFVSFPVTEERQQAVAEDVKVIRLDSANISNFSRPRHVARATTLPAGNGWEYRIGVGDILSVIVFDHPELTLPAGAQRSAEESGFLVQADGTFYYPFIGQVEASGHSVEEIRAEVASRLSAFVPDPQVVVRIAAFNSQKVLLTGDVAAPGRQDLTTRPLSLVEAVNAVGGLKDTADARNVAIQRLGKTYRVDLEGFLTKGLRHNNPILRDGDIVTVPRRLAEEAFILGQVRNPATVDLSAEPVTLTQALTRVGGLDETRADARGVFVFRADGPGITVFQLETSSPAGLLLGTRFTLEPRDVVYITRSPLQRWNDTMTSALPSVRSYILIDGIVN